jgi:hypothetical protein
MVTYVALAARIEIVVVVVVVIAMRHKLSSLNSWLRLPSFVSFVAELYLFFDYDYDYDYDNDNDNDPEICSLNYVELY